MTPNEGWPLSEPDRHYWRRRINWRVRKARRTRTLLRWTAVISANAAVAGFLILCGVRAVRHLTTTSRFTLETLEVEGTQKTTPESIRSRLTDFLGGNLLQLDLDQVAGTAGTDPWIDHASVKRILPHTLRVTVLERTPAALALLKNLVHVVDARGVVMGSAGPGLAYNLPVITGLDGKEGTELTLVLARAVEVLDRLRTADRVWAEGISEIDISMPDRVAVVSATPGPRILLDPAKVERNLESFLALRAQIDDRLGAMDYVDLRWNRRICVMPAEETLSPENE